MKLDKEIVKTGRFLSLDEFGDEYEEQWKQASKSFFKFEGLQYYYEGEDDVCDPLRNNQFEDFVATLKELFETEEEMYARAQSRGVDIIRVHSVEFPLSDYIQCQYYYYRLNKLKGVRKIYYVDSEDLVRVYQQIPLDFICFDDRVVFFHEFDDRGVFLGTWRNESSNVLRAVSEFRSIAVEHKKEIETVVQGNKEVERLLVGR